MKHVKSYLIVMLFVGLLVSAFVPLTNPMTSNEVIPNASSTSVVSYTPHADIIIHNDDEFNETAYIEGWNGDGSSGDPFIIEGYEIYSEEFLIYIEDTRYHFIIQDCNLTYAMYAIYLENVTKMTENAGGRYLARTAQIDRLEGDREKPDFCVIIEFPSREAAISLLSSDEYQPYLKQRQAGSQTELLLVAGEDVAKS